jgi:hypothetical protein
MDFKNALAQVHEASEQLAVMADGLENKNLADIIRSGSVKFAQAMEHPDVVNVGMPVNATQTGEPNPMEAGKAPLNPFDLSGAPALTQAPGAQTGEPNPMAQS